MLPVDSTPVGFHFGFANDDFGLWGVFGRVHPRGPRVRQWRLEMGRWGPVSALDTDEDEDPEEPEKRQRVLVAPHFALGADSVAAERFRTELHFNGVWNLAGYGGREPRQLYLGPLFGAGMRVLYRPEAVDPSGQGDVMLNGGLVAGTEIAHTVHLRLRGIARLSPLDTDVSILEAGALFGLALSEHGAPLALLASGDVLRPMLVEAPIDWRVGLVLMLSPGELD